MFDFCRDIRIFYVFINVTKDIRLTIETRKNLKEELGNEAP